jgi:hypothetical protein
MPSAPSSRRRLACAAAAVAAPVAALVGSLACGTAGPTRRGEAPAPPPADGRLFTRLPSSYTGVRFENRLAETRAMNVFTYRNFYNGGGVALGDLTGDGLPELVLTANQGGPRLYVNEGRFRFRDATADAGLRSADGAWTTGVTMADVNGDGRLDVYLCKAGPGAPAARANELWVNQGPGRDGAPRFEEQARAYGVADEGWSTQAAWLDYDRDGDLDLLVVNNSPKPVTGFGVFYARLTPSRYGGAKLYRHDPGPNGAPRFTEVTRGAGVHSPETAFGLGVAVGDVNRDGWPDVYVANDFFERDYLYVNRGDGTFSEQLDRQAPVLSYFSMGLDVADLDNDGWPDVYTTDMLPEHQGRLRTMAAFEGWDVYQAKVRNGYHHQVMRNTLQRNNGDGTFSDVAWQAGAARTDWSWGALAADLDLDGRKDVFVTNGLARDVTSQDYIAFVANDQQASRRAGAGRGAPAGGPPGGAGGDGGEDYLALTRAMPSTPIPNYAFRNVGRPGAPAFTNDARAWGLDAPSFSSGAAYGDLDGDGAPDLVVNNVNGEAFVYRNNARALHGDRHSLQVALAGAGGNRFGVGARVTVRAGGATMVQEQAPARGFQSSVDPLLTFGLGAAAAADTVVVEWPDGRTSTLANVAADRRLTVRQADAAPGRLTPPRPALAAPDAGCWSPPTPPSSTPSTARRTTSTSTGSGSSPSSSPPTARRSPWPTWTATASTTCTWAAGGGSPGGCCGSAPTGASRPRRAVRASRRRGVAVRRRRGRRGRGRALLRRRRRPPPRPLRRERRERLPRLGPRAAGPPLPERRPRRLPQGVKARSPRSSPAARASRPPTTTATATRTCSSAAAWSRGSTASRRAACCSSTTAAAASATAPTGSRPASPAPGWSPTPVWQDADGDGRPDLVVVGEWMPVTVFRNAGGGRLTRAAVPGLARSHGWWNRVVAGDFTGDGRVDFVVGNLGLNTRLRASAAEPATMLVKDFAGSGSVLQVVSTFDQGRSWPLVLRDDLVRAIPALKARFLAYSAYARATTPDLFTAAELAGAAHDTAYTFASSLVRNDGGGRFTVIPLPAAAQVAPCTASRPPTSTATATPTSCSAATSTASSPTSGARRRGTASCCAATGAAASRR